MDQNTASPKIDQNRAFTNENFSILQATIKESAQKEQKENMPNSFTWTVCIVLLFLGTVSLTFLGAYLLLFDCMNIRSIQKMSSQTKSAVLGHLITFDFISAYLLVRYFWSKNEKRKRECVWVSLVIFIIYLACFIFGLVW